ncbi:MAG: hypothetical protein BWY82_02628 [Verrucomicrobia bacterium ADurb.Bin474]|nr:MAG: hypothetical protein BWY82_02628 [Verrucomicrobia bacterium ADurb.Bin474]
MLLHALEECALDFCRSAVDLIREENIGEHWAFLREKLALLRVVDHGSHNI